MKEEQLESIFQELQGSFDTEEPREGHRQRFLEKMQTNKQGAVPLRSRTSKWWRPMLIAASLAFLCLLGARYFIPEPTTEQRVANISPEISETGFYFASLIAEQVRELENESTPETKKLVDDTLQQLGKLEADYKNLEQDLLQDGNSKLILSAMITNFQMRIDLLQEVMEKIDSIKNLKSHENENYTI
jgi:hypothetical protein